MGPMRWHIVTGEYPPTPGGIADYSAGVAAALAATGADVHVWMPPVEGETPAPPGVTVHQDAGHWSQTDLRRLDEALDDFPPPRRLLVQHAPNVWGFRGMNLGFCRWLRRRRRRGDTVWTMVHEVAYPFLWAELLRRPQRWVLAAVHRMMLRELIAVSARVFYAMRPAEGYIRFYGAGLRRPSRWLPVPSNVPRVDDLEGVAALRRQVAPRGEQVIGSFGTFGWSSEEALRVVLPVLLTGRDDRRALLIGRGGDRFAADLVASHPTLAGQLIAPGGQPAEDVSRHLQVCDVLVQPYIDGVSTRRTTVMAGLEHGERGCHQ